MTEPRFTSIHAHGFVRIGAASPRSVTADPASNARATIALLERAANEGCDLVVFPELGLSGYAIDDLLLQDVLGQAAETALVEVAAATERLDIAAVVGVPVQRNGRLYNCAAVVAGGAVQGLVPKTFLPNYREFYEKRQFASGGGLIGSAVEIADRAVPFGTDLLFEGRGLPDFRFAVEICEDLWAPTPPSGLQALAGALILCNLSASNITVGKAADRSTLCAAQAMRTASAYVYAAAGAGESTTDLAWDGQGSIHELGSLLSEAERFPCGDSLTIADVDVERLRLERMRTGTFNDAAALAGHPELRFRTVSFPHEPKPVEGLRRPNRRYPFVPATPERLDLDCYEAFNIQVAGLARRIEATGSKALVIGVSGGLDSTHALVVAARACDRLGLPRQTIRGYTMPGFATGKRTKANAWALMRALGCQAEEIDIRPAARQLLADMHHPFAAGEPVYDITFENVQAGLRTDYLFRLANRHGGFVLGTGDLSELALGWCTYGVGDQMSHYGVNAGVPKTLIQHLIRWATGHGEFDAATSATLLSVLDTDISPELVPADAEGALQSSEAKVGPYALNDFFLFHLLRYGLKPSKIAFLAWSAWADAEAGSWPRDLPEAARTAYDLPTIRRWLDNFLRRFFASQFKRSAMPNGVKVLAGGSLSPRGDWRMPSDASAAAWLAELETNVPESLP